MFPIHDDNPTFNKPVVVYLIIAINIVVWVFYQQAGVDEFIMNESIESLAAYQGGVLNGKWHTLLTHAFLHGSWSHIIFNMLFLWIFGNNIEDAMGHWRFMLFYMTSAVASCLPELYMADLPLIGASGAISAVMGAYLVLYPKVRIYIPIFIIIRIFMLKLPAFIVIAFYLLIDLGGLYKQISDLASVGYSAGVAYGAHVFGLIFGLAAVFMFRNKDLLIRHPYVGWGANIPEKESLPALMKVSIKTLNYLVLGALFLSIIVLIIE